MSKRYVLTYKNQHTIINYEDIRAILAECTIPVVFKDMGNRIVIEAIGDEEIINIEGALYGTVH